jgi:Arc/MetJ-type ribon-helix-helix transcriptional regulator
MKLISVKMPEALIDGMDELIKKGVYPSRSAFDEDGCARLAAEGAVV